jgi:hypothetical protein
VTLKGIIQTPEEEDEYYRNRGPIPPFQNEYGCIQDVVGYTALFEGRNFGRQIWKFNKGNYFFDKSAKMQNCRANLFLSP